MSYMHIENLYRDQTILEFKHVWAMEKIHGTSAHISYDPDQKQINYSPGGAPVDAFKANFDHGKLLSIFEERFGLRKITIYGENYGGKLQKMKDTYGPVSRFVAFDVYLSAIGDKPAMWMSVDKARTVCEDLGLDFVHSVLIPCTLEALDAERNAPSVQSVKNGILEPRMREGIVIRPPFECTCNGHRVMAKHKRDEFIETATPRKVVSPELQKQWNDAQEIAEEWVTDMRVTHVLDKIPEEQKVITNMRIVIAAMTEDIQREGSGEIIFTKDVLAAIGKETSKKAKFFLRMLDKE